MEFVPVILNNKYGCYLRVILLLTIQQRAYLRDGWCDNGLDSQYFAVNLDERRRNDKLSHLGIIRKQIKEKKETNRQKLITFSPSRCKS